MNKVTFPLTVTQSMTLYAKWEAQVTEVTYSFSNGEITDIASAPAGKIELNIPSEINGQTVTSIKYGAFDENDNIVKVTVPSTIKTIAGNAFRFCGSLSEVNLPDTVTSIGPGAFERCDSLTSIYLRTTLIFIIRW